MFSHQERKSGSKVHGMYETGPILAVFSVRKPSDPQKKKLGTSSVQLMGPDST